MQSTNRNAVPIEIANSLKTLPIASKTTGAKTYHPASRSLSVILDSLSQDPAVQTLPEFLIGEAIHQAGNPDGGMVRVYYRFSSFDDAAAAYAEPLI